MIQKIKLFFLILGFSAVFYSSFAQGITHETMNTIMQGEGLTGRSVGEPYWSVDGSSVYFQYRSKEALADEWYVYDLKTKSSKKALLSDNLAFHSSKNVKSGNYIYYLNNGIFYVYDQQLKKSTPLYQTNQGIDDFYPLTDKKSFIFLINNQFYLFSLSNGLKQLSHFKEGKAPTKEEQEQLSHLEKQQLELFESLRDDKKIQQWRKDHQRTQAIVRPFYFEHVFITNQNCSPTGKYATFNTSYYPTELETNVEHHISTSGYTYREKARSKVGDLDPNQKMYIYDFEKDTTYLMDFSSLPYWSNLSQYSNKTQQTEKDKINRNVSIHTSVFNETGNNCLIDIRSYDNKDRWIIQLDVEKRKWELIDHQHVEHWIGGPGISSWNDDSGVLGWLNSNSIYFQSEKTGFSHLYLYSIQNKEVTALTKGEFEVHDVQLNTSKTGFYLVTNENHPGVRNLYFLDVKSMKKTALSSGEHAVSCVISPDGQFGVLRKSTKLLPWGLYLIDLKNPTKMEEIFQDKSIEKLNLGLQVPEVVSFRASDGVAVYARKYVPKNANGAGILFVHGAGYLQNAHHYWSYYTREMLFHQLLAQQGYTVLDVDYRASEGYGEAYRTAIYRDMGNRDLNDFIDAKNYMVRTMGIDSNRVGIYGGSYGGFITLMGMLKTPTTFACGAALRAVTDWNHYNHEYTSNILNYPSSDTLAYRRSSPIYYAENLKNPLLLLHGMVDDNVQFQDIIRLNERFIELGKTQFQLAVYPMEAHGFQRTSAWTDEYWRIYQLFEKQLNKQ